MARPPRCGNVPLRRLRSSELKRRGGGGPRPRRLGMALGLRVSVLVGPRAGWQLAVEFSSELRIFFVDLAADADVELAALRREEKRHSRR